MRGRLEFFTLPFRHFGFVIRKVCLLLVKDLCYAATDAIYTSVGVKMYSFVSKLG